MAKAYMKWEGVEEVKSNMTIYGQKAVEAAKQLALYFAPIIEAYARENAPWQDRSGNARQGLHAVAKELSETMVALYLYGAMSYSKWLELRYSGRLKIIMPALEAHYDPVIKMLQEIFK